MHTFFKDKFYIYTFLTYSLSLLTAARASDAFYLRTDTNEPIVIDTHASEPPLYNYTQPEHVTLTTPSGIKVPALFYDRGCTTALLAAQGLEAPKESMANYAKIFNEYDVLLFDYRWNNKYYTCLGQALLKGNPVKHMLLDEEEEMRAALNFLKERKKYEKLVGLGVCYSTFLLIKIQADDTKKYGHGAFTHLILDSSWNDLKSFGHSIARDPYIPSKPQEGGAPRIIKEITKFPLIKYPIIMAIFTFLTNACTIEHIQNIQAPTLFIHGKHDLAVPLHDFEKIWCACTVPYKAALLTPYRHANNIQNKKMYKYVVEQFVAASTTGEFKERIL